MNETIKLLQNRRSVREFTGEKIKDEDLELILKTAQRAASSVNGQQISLIVVRDKDKLKKISELSHNQKHIEECDAFIFVLADFYRSTYAANSVGKRNVGPKTADGVVVGAVDAGIMVNAIETAVNALGYGMTVIGAIRSSLKEFSEMLELPQYVIPIVGAALGVPKDRPLSRLKPRVPFDSFVFFDKYDAKKVEEGVEEHEKDMVAWRKENNTSQLPTYKEMIVRIYENPHNKLVESLKSQGFDVLDEIEIDEK